MPEESWKSEKKKTRKKRVKGAKEEERKAGCESPEIDLHPYKHTHIDIYIYLEWLNFTLTVTSICKSKAKLSIKSLNKKKISYLIEQI